MVDFPEGFDLAALLEPIPGDAPQGEDIKEDSSAQSPYYRLKDARSDARDAERMLESGDTNAGDPTQLWRAVRELGVKTLTEKSKNLEVAVWVTEAYVRSHGLLGVAAGAALIKGLTEQYWDDVFPLPDEYDGVETRTMPITGLSGQAGNGTLVQPLYNITLFNRLDGTPVTLFSYQSSETLPKLSPEQRLARIEAGTPPFEDIEREARTTAAGRSLAKIRDEAAMALELWEEMGTLLDEKASEAPPSTSSVRDRMREIHGVAVRYAPAPGPAPGAGTQAADAAASGTAGGTGLGGGPGGMMSGGGLSVPVGQVASREDALRTLETLATYFRQTEPVSPLAYTLDDAIRRARMSWPDLLAEVVADAATRSAILSSLGIRPPPMTDAAEETSDQ